jgi:hypothetical protein
VSLLLFNGAIIHSLTRKATPTDEKGVVFSMIGVEKLLQYISLNNAKGSFPS